MAVDDSSSDAGSPLDTASDGPGTPPATPPAPQPHTGDALDQGAMELYQKNRAAFAEPQGDALDRSAMEAYQKYRAYFPDPAKPVAPPKAPPRQVGFGQRLGDFFTAVKDAGNNTLNAISRGAVDAVNDASNTVVGVGGLAVNAAIKGAQHATGDKSLGAEWERWYNAGDTGDINPLQVSENAKDEMFGKRQGGVYQFVENATAFTAALETGNELSGVAGIAPGAAKTLAKVGLIGLAQAAVTDPRAARLSDMIENGAPALSNPLTQFLKSDGKDSEALARLKSGLEGSMTGYAVDKFIGGLGSVVKSIIKDGSAAPAADAAIQTAKDAKPDAVTVERTADGGATIVHNPDAVVEPQGFLSGKPGRYVGFRGADPANPLGDTEKFGGTYIAQNKTYAQNFVDANGGPRIMHNAEVKVSNPFVLQTGDNADRLAQGVADAQGTPEKAAELAKSYRENGVAYLEPEAKQWLSDNGYDAVTSEIDGGNASVPGHGDPVMIALDGESVKLTPHDAEAVTSPSAPVPSGIIFNSVADAESHAAAINENFRATSIPEGHVDDMDIAALKEAVRNAPEGASAVAVLPKGVFNYNYLGGDASTQAVVESLATKLEHAFPALRNVVAGVGDTGDELTAKAMKLATQGDADSWLSNARNDADVLHAMPARQMARKFLIKSLAGKVAELSQAADINPDNVLANENLKAAGTQLLHLFSESASIDSGAGRLLQSLKNLIPDDIPTAVGEASTAATEGSAHEASAIQSEASAAAKELKEARAAVEAKQSGASRGSKRGGVDTPLQHPIDDPESVRLQNARNRAKAIIDRANGGKFEYPPLEQGPETMGKLHTEGLNYDRTLTDAEAQSTEPLTATEEQKAAARANARPQKPVLAQADWLDASEKELDRLAAGQRGEVPATSPRDPLVTPVDKAVTMGRVARGNARDAQLSGAGNANEDIVNDMRASRQERADAAASSADARRSAQAQAQEWADAKANGRVPRGTLSAFLTNDDWRQMARQIRLSEGDPALILDSIVSKVGQRAAEHDPSKWELFNSFRVNMMLSGPKTSIVLATSQALASIEAPVEYWVGGVLKGNTALRQQGADMLGGMWTNAGAAWKIAAKSFRMGESVLDSHAGIAQDSGQATAAGGPMGWLSTVMKVPTRVIMGVDEFFKNLNYLNSVRALSMRAADQDMQTAGTMSLREASEYKAQKLAEDLQSATDVNGRALNPVALSYARDATFQTPLTGFGATLQDAAQAHPWLRVIAPFIRTPYNLARYAWQRTPVLGALAGDMRADIEAGGQRQAVALGKQAVGAAIWGSAAMAVVSGNMTGAGPTDPELRKQWGPEGAGNQPYSIRIPGTDEWISYRRLDQLGTPLSMVADIIEMSGHLRVTDTENSYVKVMAALSADLLSKTFLSGIATFMDAMHSGDANAMQRLFQNTAGSLIPAAARQLDTDDRYREVRGMVDALRERVPGLSNTLEAKRNILGEPAMKPPGEFHQQWNPFTLTPGGRVDAVQDALVQLGKGMAMPAEVVNGIDLTDRKMWKRADGKLQSPYDRLLELMAHPKDGGDSLRQQLTDYINSDDWKDASPGSEQDPGGERRLTAARIIQGAQKEAMGEVMEEYPKLEQAMEDAKGIRRSALEASPDSGPVPWTGTGTRIPTRDRPAFIQ